MNNEQWRPISNYEDYRVSNQGRVKSLKYGKEIILKQNLIGKEGNKYFGVSIWKNGKIKTFRVHQLVAMAFLNHKLCGLEVVVDHLESKLCNCIFNLELVTQRENATRGYKKKKTSSKYVGVHWNKSRNKWIAQISINGKRKHLGYSTTEIEAHQAYQNELVKHRKH